MHSVKPVTLDQLETLQQISLETFTDTFGTQNTAEDLALYLDTAYSTEKLTAELKNPASRFFFIYTNEEELAGYLKLNVGEAQTEKMGPDSLEVERIYIRKAYKRRGLGRELIDLAIKTAQTEKRNDIWLGVWEKNQSAKLFYRSLNFEQVGAHTFVLGSDPQTDLIMKRKLHANEEQL